MTVFGFPIVLLYLVLTHTSLISAQLSEDNLSRVFWLLSSTVMLICAVWVLFKSLKGGE